MSSKPKAAIESIRPLHWIKSGFCLAALFLSGGVTKMEAWLAVLPLVVSMSLLSSAGYLWNDICNRDEDRLHPRKKKRPVASGRLSVREAAVLAVLVLAVGLVVLFRFYGWGWVSGLGVSYLVVAVAYNLVLRGLPLVDVLVLSLGFVIRVAAGAFALGLIPTGWLMLCTYTVSLLLGFGKRRGEVALLQSRAATVGDTREALRGYTVVLLDVLVGTSAVLSVAAYVGYTMVRSSPWIMVSVVPVVVGISEYLRWAWRSDQVEVPEKLLGRSPVLLMAVLIWIGCVLVAAC